MTYLLFVISCLKADRAALVVNDLEAPLARVMQQYLDRRILQRDHLFVQDTIRRLALVDVEPALKREHLLAQREDDLAIVLDVLPY